MAFGPEACWDCPVPLRSLLLSFLVAFGVAGIAGAVLALRKRHADIAAGTLLAALVLDIGFAAVQLRPGIDWRWRRVSDLEVYIPWTAPFAFAALCFGAFACFRLSYQAVKSRRSRLAA